jgi:hypothetical protein
MKSETSVRVAAGLTAFQSMKKERRYRYGRWNRGRLAGMGGSLPPFWPRWRPLLRPLSTTAAYDIFTVTNNKKKCSVNTSLITVSENTAPHYTVYGEVA